MAPVLLLLSLPLALCCQTVPRTECEKLPFVPGHNLVGEGFDIVYMKTTGAYVVDVQNYLTGGVNCTMCENKLLKVNQKLPASVVDWRIKVKCGRSLSDKMYESASSVLKDSSSSTNANWKIELSVPTGAGVAVGGTHSKSAKFARSHDSEDKFSYTGHTFSCRYYSFRLQARPPLTKEFSGSLQALPVRYNSQSEGAYNHFISVYGTHFLRRVDLGGRVKSTTAVRTCKVALTGLSVQDVNNCLTAEASAVIKAVKVSAQMNYCKAKQKKLETGNSFSASFSDRVTEITGGNGEDQDILFSPDNNTGYSTWLKSLKILPGVVSYTLTSLHILVNNDPARRASLQAAISKYITKNAVSISCSSKCKVGRRNGNCACKCSGHQHVNSNCCPSQLGVASLSITVVSAAGLWGDWFSKTDGYVKVFFGSSAASTPVIWNNNFPQWNFYHSFGTVILTARKRVYFEVWDRDNRWDDDLLGKGSLTPTQGNNVQKRMKLKHGTLLVSFNAKCGPNLTGPYCDKYSPSPDGGAILNPYNSSEPISLQKPDHLEENNGFEL